MESSIWTHRQDTGYQPGMNLAGFEVEATDGRIGKVDKHSDEADAGRIAVDTGIWTPSSTVTGTTVISSTSSRSAPTTRPGARAGGGVATQR